MMSSFQYTGETEDFADAINQDQSAQHMQSDLGSILFAKFDKSNRRYP